MSAPSPTPAQDTLWPPLEAIGPRLLPLRETMDRYLPSPSPALASALAQLAANRSARVVMFS